LSFPARDVMAIAAAKIALGSPLSELGAPLDSVKRLLGRSMRATKKQIAGHVFRVDHYGNLITNIQQAAFKILSTGKQFAVKFGRENFSTVHDAIHQTGNGDIFIIFNSLGFLEIG